MQNTHHCAETHLKAAIVALAILDSRIHRPLPAFKIFFYPRLEIRNELFAHLHKSLPVRFRQRMSRIHQTVRKPNTVPVPGTGSSAG